MTMTSISSVSVSASGISGAADAEQRVAQIKTALLGSGIVFKTVGPTEQRQIAAVFSTAPAAAIAPMLKTLMARGSLDLIKKVLTGDKADQVLRFLRTTGFDALIDSGSADELAQVMSSIRRGEFGASELKPEAFAPMLKRLAAVRGAAFANSVGVLLDARGSFKSFMPTPSKLELLDCGQILNGLAPAVIGEMEISEKKAELDGFTAGLPTDSALTAALGSEFKGAKANVQFAEGLTLGRCAK